MRSSSATRTPPRRRCLLADLFSKSQFLALHQCRLRYWLSQNEPGLAEPVSVGVQLRAEIGREIDEIAQQIFPGAQLAPRHDDPLQATAALLQAITEGATGFLQPTVAADGLLARLDVLRIVDGVWRISEVKSATKAKDTHVLDLAFQWRVAKLAGIDPQSASVVHINTKYVFDGGLDPSQLLTEVEVTKEVHAQLAAVEATLQLRQDGGSRPEIAAGKHCSEPYDCPFLKHCEGLLDPDDIYFAPSLFERDRVALRARGIRLMSEIADDDKVPAQVIRARDTIRFDRPALEPDLAPQLQSLQFPLLFIDFEGIEPPVPRYVGTKPYQRMPFQWSAHLMREEGGPVEHDEYLWDEDSDPSAAFVATLAPLVAQAGTVAVYSQYEQQTIKRLADQGVVGAKALLDDFMAKEWDMLKVIRSNIYDRKFKGSFSIKYVLPALAPEEGYDDLAVKNGDEAVAAYRRMIAMPPGPDRDTARQNLLAYCQKDTWAMVVIYQRLRSLAGLA